MSEFIMFNKDKVELGELSSIKSAQILEKFRDAGEMKFIVSANAENRELLKNGYSILDSASGNRAFIRASAETQNETEKVFIIRCVLASRLFTDRVVMGTINVKNVEAAMIKFAGFADDIFMISPASNFPDSLTTEISWGSSLEGLTTLAESSGLGFSAKCDYPNRYPDVDDWFKVLKGTDRTDIGNSNYIGELSERDGSLSNVEVENDEHELKNVAIVAGEDSGTERVVEIVSLGKVQGYDRREVFIDARDLQSEYQEATDTGDKDESGNPVYTYVTKKRSASEYKEMLRARGLSKLSELIRKVSISAIVTQKNIEYNKDYLLGDRLPVSIEAYGYAPMSAEVSEILRIEENSSIKYRATLSNFKLEEE